MELLVFSVRSGAAGVRHLPYLPPVRPAVGICHFALYAIRKGFSLSGGAGYVRSGVRAAKNILTTFVLIGIPHLSLAGGGTIPAIVCYSVQVMEPRLFLVCSFLLNCLVSFLTGTAFGSAATMGAVCMTMAAALGADPLMTGGAIPVRGLLWRPVFPRLHQRPAGGRPHRDRPVWEHPADAADLPGPFALAAGLYLLFGLSSPAAGQAADIAPLFALEFRLGPLPLIPAALILVLSALRVRVKAAMLASIAAAAVLCLAYQGAAP